MNENQANQLAAEFKDAFTSGPNARALVSALCAMHYGPAEKAVGELIRHAERTPNIASLWAVYNKQLGTAHDDGPVCEEETCGGTGWITCVDHPAHWPGDPQSIPVNPKMPELCICNVVRPCPRCNRNYKRKQHAA